MNCPHYQPQQWPPQMYQPVYGPLQPSSLTLDQIKDARRMLKDLEDDIKKNEKKDDPKKPKAPTLTLGQALACMVLFGPLVGYAYLLILYSFIQNAQNLIK